MPASREDQSVLAAVNPPSDAVVRSSVRNYMREANMVAADLAAEVGYARATIDHFLNGRYADLGGNTAYLRAHLWKFMQENPLADGEEIPRNLLRTQDTRKLLGLCEEARRHRRIIVAEGPPGTCKTTALAWYAAERNRLQKRDAIYFRATTEITGKALLSQLCRLLGGHFAGTRERLLNNAVRKLRQLKEPVLLIDEAQHLLDLNIRPFEQLRDVAEKGRCGCVLAGHFTFLQVLTNGLGSRLEQWVQRVDIHEPLHGVQPDELPMIEREWFGHELPDDIRKLLIAAATVRDRNAYARAALHQSPTKKARPTVRYRYISMRRLRKLSQHFHILQGMPENAAEPEGKLVAASATLLLQPAWRAL